MQPHEQRRLSTPCSFKNVRRISAFARSCCEGLMPEGDASLVELAVVEAANNIVGHSYRDSQGWPMEICARLDKKKLEFILSDGGLPFDPAHVPDPIFDWPCVESVPEHGRGLFLIKSIMDDVKFLHCGEINISYLSKLLKTRIPSDDGAEIPDEPSPFVCDCADPFLLMNPPDSFALQAASRRQTPPPLESSLVKAIPEMTVALSLQTDSGAAFDKLAEALRVNFAAAGCAIWRRQNDVLFLCGVDGDAGERRETISLGSTELEAQTASLRYETSSEYGPDGYRLCVPLSGLGKLLGVATLHFGSKEELKRAKLSAPRELTNIISVAMENQTLYAKALDAERSRKEMETAANLHKGIVSMLVPNVPGLAIYAKSQSALEVGGDYLSFRKSSGDVLWFMICDAMGKGMSASFFSLLSHMTFQSVLFIQDDIDPGELLTLSNRILSRDFDRFEMFMTALVGKIDMKTRVMKYASAGHCPPILYHPQNGSALLDTQDYMLGVDSEIEYKTLSVPFTKGMRLVAYTDGLTDIVGPDGEMVGVEPLLDACDSYFRTQTVIRGCERIFSDATASCDGKLQDDITLVGIECL